MFWDGPNVKNRRRKECPWAGDLETGAEHDNVSSRTATVESSRGNADVAQLVAHHLAKVRVASSSLVIRSVFPFMWKTLLGAISSVGERFPDTEEVTGSIPVSRTEFLGSSRAHARHSSGWAMRM